MKLRSGLKLPKTQQTFVIQAIRETAVAQSKLARAVSTAAMAFVVFCCQEYPNEEPPIPDATLYSNIGTALKGKAIKGTQIRKARTNYSLLSSEDREEKEAQLNSKHC